MDDVIYDTSLTLYAVTDTIAELSALLTADQDELDTNALKLRDHLSIGRARYEDEEEHEKIGGLRDCTWRGIHLEGRDPLKGLVISLLYDKITYRFVFFASSSNPNSSARQRKQQPISSLPLLLIKASTSLTSRFLAFLTIHFRSSNIHPLKLPPSHLSTTLLKYISSLATAHHPIAADHSLQAFLQDTIGAIKFTITVTSAEIAKNLRSIDIDIPPETLFQLLNAAPPHHHPSNTSQPQPPTPPTSTSPSQTFLANLQHHVHQRTGLILPLTAIAESSTTTTTTNNDPVSEPGVSSADPPLKLTRLSTTAFALSSDPTTRLKLAARAVQAVEAIPGLDSGVDGNVVRMANAELLRGLLDVASAIAAAAAAAAADDDDDDDDDDDSSAPH